MLQIFQRNNPFFLSLGEMGTVAGWGRLSEGGQLPSILQYVRYLTYQYKTAIFVKSHKISLYTITYN